MTLGGLIEGRCITLGVDDYSWSPDEVHETPASAYFSLASEVGSGDMRRGLAAVRNRLAEELGVSEGKDVAPLALALIKVMESLERVPDLAAADPLNEIAERRERRRADQQARRQAAGE